MPNDDPPERLWDHVLALRPGEPARVVSAGGGVVVAVGDALHSLGPGAARIRSRPLPDFEVIGVAVEPWSPNRIALATPGHVHLYTGHRPYTSTMDIELSSEWIDPTHLAWAHDGDASVLYVREDTGVVIVYTDGPGPLVTLEGTNAAAVAADPSGAVAMISFIPVDSPEVWHLPVGDTEWDSHELTNIPDVPEGEGFDVPIYLATRGLAVAYSMDNGYAEVSWDLNDDTQAFASPPGTFMGPIAFESATVLHAAHNADGEVRILRHVRGRGVTCIARFGGPDVGDSATITSLAWDDERRALWAASPELGLIKLTAPKPATRFGLN